MNKTIEVQALEQNLEQSEAKYKTNLTGEIYYKGFFAGLRQAIEIIKAEQKPLTASSGKEKELQFLTQIAEACGEGSYLHTLLSEDLIGWAERTILEGEKPDVYGYWLNVIKECKKEASRAFELSMELSVKEVEYQNEVTRLEALLTQTHNDLQAEIAKWKQKYEVQGVYWSNLCDHDFSKYKNSLQEKDVELSLQNNQVKQAALELQSLRQTTNRQYTEILLLKAEVYDLTHQRED